MDEVTLVRVSDALDKIAEGIAELSLAVRGATPAVVADDDLPTFEDDSAPVRPHRPARRAPTPKPSGRDRTRCPAHDKQWRRGRFGAYCPSQSDDPDWSNDNGYCTITPETAPDYLATLR